MNTNKILNLLIAVLLLTGCDYNDKYFDGLDELSKPTDIKRLEYTLTEADYATIANNATNKSIAKAAGLENELAAIKTTLQLTDKINAKTYLPAFIASKWFTADNTSSVKITYNSNIGLPEYLSKLSTATIGKVSAEDYKTVWGEESTTNFFTPLNSAKANVPTILLSKYPDAANGDIVAMDYNESENEPSGSVIAVNEDFEGAFTETVYEVEIEGWQNVITKGQNAWGGRVFSGNSYIQASANNHAEDMEVYMISPKFKVSDGLKLSFEACYGFYKADGGRVAVLVTLASSLTDPSSIDAINAATWTDISSSFSIKIPTSNYGTLENVGEHDLSSYAGKEIYIAFKYYGNGTAGATTTVQMDNVVVKSEATGESEDVFVATTGLFKFNGTAWSVYSENNALMITKSDFSSMGSNYDNFSSSMNPNDYLPVFLKLKFPYAKAGDIKSPVYKYFASSVTSIRADEYEYSGTEWIKNNAVEVTTDQFVRAKGSWNYDPSTTIVLNVVKNDPVSTPFYQAITDWVIAKHPEYVTSYKNNDYYYGGSAYNNNFDFRLSAWKSYYDGMTDDAIKALMFERLPESFPHALEVLYADADAVEGVDVIYTIQFSIYDGTSTTPYSIQYLVTGKGKFEYIKDSLAKL